NRSIVWTGQTDASLEVLRLRIPHSADTIELLDPDRGPKNEPFQNLARLHPDGSEVWRAQLPQLEPPNRFDSYVAAQWDQEGRLVANTWSGFRAILDPETGVVLDTIFTK